MFNKHVLKIIIWSFRNCILKQYIYLQIDGIKQ